MERRRVVITGLGAVTPIGLTAAESWQAVKDGVCGIAPITQFDPTDLKVHLAAEVKGFVPENYMRPETLKGLWKQRLRWAQGGAEVFLVNLRRLFHWQHHRMWPLFLEYACSTLWAFAYAITILLFILSRLMPLPDNLAVHSLFPPEFTGMLLGLMCLLQFVASLYIERRYEKKVAKSLFWVIWFPMVYWMIGLLTTLVAFPKVMVKRQRSRARWVSPDRGKGSL